MHDTPEAAQNRYDEFIASLGSSGVAFLLSQGNGFANYDDDGEQVIPIWSTRDAAAAGAAEQFATYEVMEFTADQLVSDLLPTASQKGMWVAVNPTPALTGISVPAATLANELARAV